MFCYVESEFCTVTVIAFSTVFRQNLPYIQFLLASCALHYDIDWMYDLQDLQTVSLFAYSRTQSVCLVLAHPSNSASLFYEVFFCFQPLK